MENHLVIFGRQYHENTTFDQCKLYGTDLMENLGYVDWNHFESIIRRAIAVCEHIDIEVEEHFKPVYRNVGGDIWKDYRLSPLACYLVTANGDSNNATTGRAQVYFMKKYFGKESFAGFSESVF